MKFLYLKGVEVLGPLEAKQLLQESWFSNDILVCPEDKAEQETAWKSAKDYPEFKTSLEQEIFSAGENKTENKAEIKPPLEVPAPPVSQEVKPAAPAVQPPAPAAPEKKENSLQDKLQDLPALEDTKTEPPAETKKKEEDIHEIVEETIPSLSSPVLLSDEPQDHTFRIPQKGDDNILEDLPSQSIFESNEEEKVKKQALTPEEAPAVAAAPAVGNKPAVPDHSSPLEDPILVKNGDDTMAKEHSFLEISNNKIISSSDGRVKKTKKNDSIFILIVIAIAIIGIAVSFALLNWNNGDSSSQKQNAGEPVAVEQDNQTEPVVEDNNLSNNATAQQAPTVEDQTIDIVKKTMLKNKGKTVEEYFKSVFDDNYQTSWSSKPFTDKVYIVEFFASQVRNEPYVYLFRVDTEQQKITGALNNITLDLLG